MRVSQKQLYQPLVTGIQDTASRIQELRAKIGTAKKVNTPSDDPIAAGRIMNFQEKKKGIEQFLANVRDANSLIESEVASLENVHDGISRVRTLLVMAADGTMVQSDRSTIAKEINIILEHVFQTGNATHLGKYIFSGSQTKVQPFEATIVGGEITDVKYKGDRKAIEYQIGEGIDFQVNRSGSEIFLESAAGSPTKTVKFRGSLDKNTPIGGTSKTNVVTFDSDGRLHTLTLTFTKTATPNVWNVAVTSPETGVTFTDSTMNGITYNAANGTFLSHADTDSDSDGNPEITVNFGLGSQLINFNLSNTTETSGVSSMAVDSRDGKAGGYGAFSNLIAIRDLLQNKGGLDVDAQLTQISEQIGALDVVRDRIFGESTTFGAKVNNLEITGKRLEDASMRIDLLRSFDEDADIVKLITELTAEENTFRATLASGARIAQVSLLDFI